MCYRRSISSKSHCTICGVAIRSTPPRNEVPRWPYAAVLLHKEDEPFADCHISELRAQHVVGSRYKLHDVAGNVRAFSCLNPQGAGERPLYIPCHVQCLHIAKLAISSKRVDPVHHLWLALLSRIEALKKYIDNWPERPSDPHHGKFNETIRCTRAQRELIDSDVEEQEMYGANPLEIPDITLSICRHLEEISISDLATAEQNAGLPQMPQEIIDLVWRYMCPLSDPPVACTRLSSPGQWHYALRDLKVLPWLWDIDTNVLDIKEKTRSVDRCWDWESLIRRLATQDTYSLENDCDGDTQTTRLKVTRRIEGLHPGLRNRRRIWNLTIEMLDALDD